jgi:hypothetical protein
MIIVLVDGDEPASDPAAMIQDHFDHIWGMAKPRHAGGRCSSKVMEAPRRQSSFVWGKAWLTLLLNAGDGSIQRLFSLAVVGNRRALGGSKDKPRPSVSLGGRTQLPGLSQKAR